MNGDNELIQLARLLQLGAETARQIASMREGDGSDICRLAKKADDIAESITELVEKSWKIAHLPYVELP